MRRAGLAIPVLLLVACGQGAPPEPSGRDVFLRYCASCHGSEGRGDGPMAAALTKRPSDLTQLAARSGGHYDERAVMSAIDGRRSIVEHGTPEMPVWGVVFEQEGQGQPYPAYASLLRSRLLVDYLATIQARTDR